MMVLLVCLCGFIVGAVVVSSFEFWWWVCFRLGCSGLVGLLCVVTVLLRIAVVMLNSVGYFISFCVCDFLGCCLVLVFC